MKQLTELPPLLEGILIGTFLTFLAYMVGVQFVSIPIDLEFLAVWTSFICTYMFVIQTRWCYYVGVVTTALYSYIFWQSGLIGSMILNIYLVPTLIYGWFIWGRDEVTRPVEFVKMKYWPYYILATVFTYAGAYGIVNYFGGEMAFLDSWILIGTILAQYLLDRKKIEQCFVWIGVNVVSIYVYWNAGLPFVTIQYILFLANTGFMYYMWNRSMNKEFVNV